MNHRLWIILAAVLLLREASSNVARAETILLVSDAGYFWLTQVDGKPTVSEFPYQVVDLRGNGDVPAPPAPDDPVATQIDKWSDLPNDQETRKQLVELWATCLKNHVDPFEVAACVEEGHKNLLQTVDWKLWRQRVNGLIVDRQRLGYDKMATFKSIKAGLSK